MTNPAARPADPCTILQTAGARPAAAESGPSLIGALLNNIYRVDRFLARGGMGEVYEGINVNTEERVAIKVMLPHLAADQKIQGMFRKEARILTELAHPALVRYRVLAWEPERGLFYIVTEFIDGHSVADLIGKRRLTTSELFTLTRRLAEGLAAAHAVGAVHRDISPDNVLMPDGRLDQAKIIDFGIARESTLAHQTLIGDTFAGKLGYVAPEQFGDFDRSIGPWTDVYSLGLVILALASGDAPDMGVTLVEAVERRREGPKLDPLPAALRPVFQKMLAPDPKARFQSMPALIEALDALRDAARRAAADKAARPPAPAVDAAPAAAAIPAVPPAAPEAAPRGKPPLLWLIGGGAALVILALVAALAVFLFGGRKAPSPAPAAVPQAALPAAVEAAPIEAAPAVVPASAPAPAAPATPPAAVPAKAARPAEPRLRVSQAPAEPPAPAAAAPVAEPAHRLTPSAAATPAPAAARPAAEPQENAAASEACWQATGETWAFKGYGSRAACAAKVFTSCEVIYGRWGKQQLRHYGSDIQIKSGGLISRWKTFEKAAACAPPADPS